MTRELVLDGRRESPRSFAAGERSRQPGLGSRAGAGGREAGPETVPGVRAGPGGYQPARLRLVDTVGFIRKLPHHLVASFRATLEEVREADILLHVIDASHPDWEEQLRVVDGVLADLARPEAPVIHVFNKVDRLGDVHAFRSLVAPRYPHAVLVSALRGEVEDLLRALELLAQPGGFAPLALGVPSQAATGSPVRG